ncbi:MAG: MarR family transcriptional regulator [Micromonosporaceae bacterium]|nr:MarR family transcriptional regulator [Micromonosporaceae bacterium]
MLPDSVLIGLHRATHRSLQALVSAVGDLGLTGSEINVMANLAGGRVLSVRELARETGTRATTLTGVLDRLERRGYLVRKLDRADRRSFRITLTRSGRAVAGRVNDAVRSIEGKALAGVSSRQLAGFRAVVAALEEI